MYESLSLDSDCYGVAWLEALQKLLLVGLTDYIEELQAQAARFATHRTQRSEPRRMVRSIPALLGLVCTWPVAGGRGLHWRVLMERPYAVVLVLGERL